jgi:hypothetical protein
MMERRLEETLGMAMIGDGVLGIVAPVEHCRLWQSGPPWWQRMIRPFLEHPGATRCLAAAELGLGLWLARRAEDEPRPAAEHR